MSYGQEGLRLCVSTKLVYKTRNYTADSVPFARGFVTIVTLSVGLVSDRALYTGHLAVDYW